MKKVLLFIILYALGDHNGYGQVNAPVTAEYRQFLYEALNTTRTDSAKLPLLNKIGKFYLSKFATTQNKTYTDSAVAIFKKSVVLSARLHMDEGDGRYECLRLLGTAYLIKQDTAAARIHIMQYIRYYSDRNQPKKIMMAWLKYGESSMRAHFENLAIACFNKALPIAVQLKSTDEEIYLKFLITLHIQNSGNQGEAEKNYLAIIKQYEGSGKNLDKIYYTLANYYRYRGSMKRSLFYGLAAVKDLELHQDSVNIDAYYGEVALIYESLGQTEKSIAFYRKTLQLREGKNMPEEYILRTSGFVIQGLIKLGKFKEALYEAGTVETRHPPATPFGQAIIAQNKAYCYQALRDYPRAERYFLKMMRDYERPGIPNEVTLLARYDISNFYAVTKKYAKAQNYLHTLTNPLPSVDIYKKVELLRFKIDSGLANYQQAMDHYVNYQKVKDSIFNEAKSKQIEELQIKYETGQKEKNIKLLKQDGQIQRERVKLANKIQNLAFAGLGILLLILSLLYKSYHSNQRKTKEIALKNSSLSLLLAEKDDLLAEKEWLIREVHHRVKNNLQIVMGLLQRQSSFVDNKEALAAIRNSEHRMHSISLIHQKLYESESLMLVKMVDYINEMIGYLRDSFDLGERIRFDKQIGDIYFEINMAVPLGLILNEAVTNSIKYAFPDNRDCCIRIALYQTGEHQYVLEITDNGCGVPADFNFQTINSMGFNLMRGLSKQLGGKLSVSSIGGMTIKTAFSTGELHK